MYMVVDVVLKGKYREGVEASNSVHLVSFYGM